MILLVDDDPGFLEQAECALGAVNHRGVLLAGNAQHAMGLAALLRDELSVVLIDLNLPTVDGFELIAQLRKEYPRLPLIAISGVFSGNVLESARAVGAADVLSKPITKEWPATVERVRSKRDSLNRA